MQCCLWMSEVLLRGEPGSDPWPSERGLSSPKGQGGLTEDGGPKQKERRPPFSVIIIDIHKQGPGIPILELVFISFACCAQRPPQPLAPSLPLGTVPLSLSSGSLVFRFSPHSALVLHRVRALGTLFQMVLREALLCSLRGSGRCCSFQFSF